MLSHPDPVFWKLQKILDPKVSEIIRSISFILNTHGIFSRLCMCVCSGIAVTDAIVVVNREQGGAANIEQNDIRLHSLFTLSQLLGILKESGKIDDTVVASVADYIAASQCPTIWPLPTVNKRTTLTYEARKDYAKSPVAKTLLTIIAAKKTNLCLAVDLTKSVDVLNAAEAAGPFICLLKTHADIIEDFNDDFVHSLTALAKKHNFIIMEDRKFADIGNTVGLQYSSGIFKISSWAQLITIHSLTGPSILKGLKNALSSCAEDRGVFLLAEISSADNLISTQYTEATSKLAESDFAADFVAGVVCQNKDVVKNCGLLQLTPGCNIDTTSDDLGQQYESPEYVIKEKGADIVVVGRGILCAKDLRSTAEKYRDRLWAAYCERVAVGSQVE